MSILRRIYGDAGFALRLVAALAVGRAIAGRVAGASAFDPVVFGTIAAVVALAGIVASFVPALRAARVSPAVALRYE